YMWASVIGNKQAWLLVENTLYHFDQAIDGKKLSPFLNKRYIAVPRATEKRYFETFVTGLIEKHHVYAEGFDIRTHREDAKPLLKLIYTEPGDSSIQLSFAYGPYEYSEGTVDRITVCHEHQEYKDH